jgi:dienelactone hydrolase
VQSDLAVIKRESLLALLPLAALLAAEPTARAAEEPAPAIRKVPPPGIELQEPDRRALEDGLAALGQELRRLAADPKAAPHLPDVSIYYQAVRVAFDHQEFFDPADIGKAKALLAAGTARARLLAKHQTPWLTTPGPTALGYVSALDGSVQPYGLYIPGGYVAQSGQRRRLDAWFHGRGEKLSEVNFIDSVSALGKRDVWQFVRPDAFLVQPYGRYCNGSKLAGEVDFFEVLADVKRRVPVDEDRIVVRGFSLGGASVWHLAAHFASDWAAAAPGAGFSETPEFLRTFANETLTPTWWQRKLWQLYDAPVYAENFRNVPVVAYSGEKDKQKQAADLMAGALEKVNVPLVHVIGPGTAHSYHPEAVATINRLVDALAARGRDPAPRRVSLVTPTLKYNRQAWVTLDALGKHWDRAEVQAEVVGDGEVALTTRNVTALTLDMPAGRCPFSLGRATVVRLDGQRLAAGPPRSDRSWTARFQRTGTRWQLAPATAPAAAAATELRKRHGLQGPIDDAFMGSFVIVTPSGEPWSRPVARWAQGEQRRAIDEWRRQLRGEPRVRRDSDLTPEEIAAHNLVLWGDPGSNAVLAKIADRLPIKWTRQSVVVGKQAHPSERHALLAIYPNPLNPARYVVLNSGFTFREYDYLNNARQIPKLPDWAVVDIETPPDARAPGKIVDAGFFGEKWELVAGPRPAAPEKRPAPRAISQGGAQP